MISKFLYVSFLSGFVFMFFSTSQLPRLIYTNFIAAPVAAQQPVAGEAQQQQQPAKRTATREASQQKVSMLPAAQVSAPKTMSSQTPAQLGFLFAVSLLNLFIGYKLIRWTYRTFLQTPLYLISKVFSFLFVKPYRYLFTPKIIARYDFMYSVPNSTEPRTIIVQ
jgi:hypothetical protein